MRCSESVSGSAAKSLYPMEPVCDMVPSGARLVHHLQVLDSKHLKNAYPNHQSNQRRLTRGGGGVTATQQLTTPSGF
jgi:hypothetical protein